MLEQINAFISTVTGQASIIALILDFAFRLIKTEKPLSIAYIIAETFHRVGSMLGGIGALLDKVLPQRLK